MLCRQIAHRTILVLGGGSLVLGAGLDSVAVVLCIDLLHVFRRAAYVLLHVEGSCHHLLIRLIGQLVNELRPIFIDLTEVGIQI